MSVLTNEQRSMLLTKFNEQSFSKVFTNKEINLALDSGIDVFNNFEQVFSKFGSYVIIQCGKTKRPINIISELIPPMIHAHRYFGDTIPINLKHKLINPFQTHNTLFELECLGIFQRLHKVIYEPLLSSGKVPDLSIESENNLKVFIECKFQGITGTKSQVQFMRATTNTHNLLNKLSLTKKANSEGNRIEVYLNKMPTSNDFEKLNQLIDYEVIKSSKIPIEYTESITIGLVSKNSAYRTDLPFPSGHLTVGSTPTKLDSSSVDLAIYPWPGLINIRRRSQKRLLARARKKLRDIPNGSYGLICIQTFGTKDFEPDVHYLIDQPVFERIPIVWLNPSLKGESIIISREGCLEFRRKILLI